MIQADPGSRAFRSLPSCRAFRSHLWHPVGQPLPWARRLPARPENKTKKNPSASEKEQVGQLVFNVHSTAKPSVSEKEQALVGQLVFNFHFTVRIESETKPLGVGERTSTSRSVGIQFPLYVEGRIRSKTPRCRRKDKSVSWYSISTLPPGAYQKQNP